jgi:putative membrane protein
MPTFVGMTVGAARATHSRVIVHGAWCQSHQRLIQSAFAPDRGYRMTIGFLAWFYPWTKALHVISLIAWMAGMLYLPRLYVYHCDTLPGSVESERFKVMEYRLLRQITNPAMIATWTFGILLVLTPGVIDWSAHWWHVKLTCVLLLSGFHGMLSRWRREFANDQRHRPQRFYRIANEVPTVLMVIIVIMVIVRPF